MEKIKIISEEISKLRHRVAQLLFTVKKEEVKIREILELIDEAIDNGEVEKNGKDMSIVPEADKRD